MPQQSNPHEGDTTGGVIPYKNPSALIAYYCGVFSLIPCIGIIPGIAAVILGIMGLSACRANPAIRGTIHAWVGIVLGTLATLVWGAVIVLGIVSIVVNMDR